MKIKLALLDFDKNFVQRFYNTINRAYNKLEIHAFTKESSFINFLNDNTVDILLINESINLNIQQYAKLIVIKLLENNILQDDLSINNISHHYIYKYQRISLIYKEILQVYSNVYKSFDENSNSLSDLSTSSFQEFNNLNNTTTISFMSQGLGSGTSTIASSLSLKLAESGKKTLLLDLQSFATINSIFSSEGNFDMSEIIYALKSNKDKDNIAVKLEAALKMDDTGLYFYDPCHNPFDTNELKSEELIKLLHLLSKYGEYEYIIIDINYSLNELCLSLLKDSDKVFFVTEAKEEHQIRLNKILKSISIKEMHDNQEYMNKVGIVCNKFINIPENDIHYEEFEFACYIPKYNDVNIKSIVKEIAKTSILDTLIPSKRGSYEL